MRKDFPHNIGLPTAKTILQAAHKAYAEEYKAYKPTIAWKDDTHAEVIFQIGSSKLRATFVLTPTHYQIEMVNVPMLFQPFVPKALAIIENELKIWLAKAKAGQISAA